MNAFSGFVISCLSLTNYLKEPESLPSRYCQAIRAVEQAHDAGSDFVYFIFIYQIFAISLSPYFRNQRVSRGQASRPGNQRISRHQRLGAVQRVLPAPALAGFVLRWGQLAMSSSIVCTRSAPSPIDEGRSNRHQKINGD